MASPPPPAPPPPPAVWLSLVIGNTSLHWALFAPESGSEPLGCWDAPHLEETTDATDAAAPHTSGGHHPMLDDSNLPPETEEGREARALLVALRQGGASSMPAVYCASVVPVQTARAQEQCGDVRIISNTDAIR